MIFGNVTETGETTTTKISHSSNTFWTSGNDLDKDLNSQRMPEISIQTSNFSLVSSRPSSSANFASESLRVSKIFRIVSTLINLLGRPRAQYSIIFQHS